MFSKSFQKWNKKFTPHLWKEIAILGISHTRRAALECIFHLISIMRTLQDNYGHYVENLINQHTGNVQGKKERTLIELLSQIRKTGYMSTRYFKKTVGVCHHTPGLPAIPMANKKFDCTLIRIKFLKYIGFPSKLVYDRSFLSAFKLPVIRMP